MRDPEMLSIGTIFDDRYVILGVLGAGGFGVVYKAKEVKVFDRLVALKRIHPHLLHDHPAGGERFLEMFEEEARILTLVTHPGVMHLLNWGTDERGVPYIVTEMLRGKALAMPAIPDAASRDEYMTVVTPFLAAMDQLLEILGCCHKEQVIHCDLKPDNVMMQNTYGLGSLARVMDFGIARILTGGGFSRPEDPHGIRITPDFAAPEQFEAKPLTPAVDLYALGCMLNLGLSGAPDYIMADGDTHREWAKKVHHQRRTRETYRPGAPVPDLLASVVECALVSDPGGRFSDAAEFREALREAANQEALELDLPLPFGGTQLVTVVCQEAPDPPGAESVAPPIRTPSVPAQTDPMVVGECVVVFPLDAPDAEAYRAAYERDLLPRLRRLSGEPELLPRLLATSQLAPGRMDEAEMEALEYARLLLWELGRLPEGVNQILHLYAMAGRAVPLLLAGTNPPPELLHLRAHPYGDLGPGAGGREERLERSIEASLGQRWWPRAMMAQWRDRKTTTRLLLAASNHLMRGDDRRALSVMGDLVASAPDNPLFRYRKAALECRRVENEEGWRRITEVMEQVVELIPEHAPAWRQLGVAQDKLGQRSRAMASLRRAVDLAPEDHDAWASFGGVWKRKAGALALEMAESRKEAIHKYGRGVDVSGGHPYPLLNLIRLQALELGELKIDEAAERRLEAAVEERSLQAAASFDQPWCHLDRSEALLYLGRREEAVAALRQGEAQEAYTSYALASFLGSLDELSQAGIALDGMETLRAEAKAMAQRTG